MDEMNERTGREYAALGDMPAVYTPVVAEKSLAAFGILNPAKFEKSFLPAWAGLHRPLATLQQIGS